MKQSFQFGGMNIAVQSAHLTPPIIKALSSGQYENAERAAIERHVRAGDRVLDLGGGIGCTGVVAGRIVGGDNLMIVEANDDLMDDISDNLAANGIKGAQLIQAAVVAQKSTPNISFFKTKGFWAGSLLSGNAAKTKRIEVSAYAFSDALKMFKPTVVVCDTEGLETELFKRNLPSYVRLIIMELHPNLYGQDTIKSLFDCLSDMWFSYIPYGSRGPVVCFGRKKRP
ncbi:FkbM family methyltransferase [Amylibacter sp. SFDW26]|uniref:FkbM family methyltransferase n=1 Tax=Amylibacter sp. SFDW26 TaxID=2652722 RepID=UPI001262A1AE|nr:FkbM family methyltransferase [Amylibacter sp. SFDW26]KAB7615279.1 FkbM family methyltransferase [Amylibacter sp. SFDW26]